MRRKIITYGGYFERFMETLKPQEQKKIKYGLLMLKTGDIIPTKFVRSIRDGLFELRTEYEGNIFRVFFIFDEGRIVVLFNGFQKKTQKTPEKEIQKALRLKQEYDEKKRNETI